MNDDIVNRVSSSKLVTIDLEDFYPEGNRIELDISQWLADGIVLREKEFRSYIKNHNWVQYKDCYLALHCSTDAIVPAWAYMLISTASSPFTKKTIVGSIENLEIILFAEIIEKLDLSSYTDRPVIIKGCANKPIPENAYVLLIQRIQPIAKSVMYGEACSSVPLFKK